MAWLVELFAFGTLWFWIAVSCFGIGELILVALDKPGPSTFLLVVLLAFLEWICHIPILKSIAQHPFYSLLWVLAYFVLGVIWSGIKWALFASFHRRRYLEVREKFYVNKGLDNSESLTEDLKKDWAEFAYGEGGREDISGYDNDEDRYFLLKKPNVTNHKGDITFWMTYWPWSFFWTMFDDPIRRAFKWIYLHIRQVFQKISDRIWQGFEDDLPEDPAKPKKKQKSLGDNLPKDIRNIQIRKD